MSNCSNVFASNTKMPSVSASNPTADDDKVEVGALQRRPTLRYIPSNLRHARQGDHSTIVHMMKQHEVYTKGSPFYRYNYSMALKVVEDFATKHKMVQRVMLESSVLCVKTELEVLNRTIVQLKRRRAKIEESINNSLDVSNLSPTFVHN